MTIEIIGILAFAVLLGLPLMLGPAIVKREMARCARLLDHLIDEAIMRNLQESPEMKMIIASVVGFIACAPLLGVGKNVPNDGSLERTPPLDFKPFFEAQGWLLPYLTTFILSIFIVQFAGKPWNPKHMVSALLAWGVFRFLSKRDGTVRVACDSESCEQVLRETLKADPKFGRIPFTTARTA